MTKNKIKKIEELIAISTKNDPELNHRWISHSKLLNAVTADDIIDYTIEVGKIKPINNKSKIVMIRHLSTEAKK